MHRKYGKHSNYSFIHMFNAEIVAIIGMNEVLCLNVRRIPLIKLLWNQTGAKLQNILDYIDLSCYR